MKRYIRAAEEAMYEYNGMEFNEEQMKQINKGLAEGLDVSIYANPSFHWLAMTEILKGLEEGIDVSWYADPDFDFTRMRYIRYGLEQGLDVSTYAKPEFNEYQMNAILYGLKKGVDVTWCANPEFDYQQMYEIIWGLEQGLDVSLYADPKYSDRKMQIIRYGLKHNIDTSWVEQNFDKGQLYYLYEGLERGLDVSQYADSSIPGSMMEKIEKKLLRKTYGGDFLSSLTSKKVVSGIANALNVDTSIAKIIAKWYAEDENPNDYKTVSEYVQDIADGIEYRMNEIYLNEGMEGLRDIDPKYAEEFVRVADALGIELDEEW